MKSSFLQHYKGKKVLVTGHTGFKGSWLCAWLKQLGAEVIGISLPPTGTLNLFESAHIANGMTSLFADICDYSTIKTLFEKHQPEIIFHLAAQALVRPSYRDPVNTYATNVLGTVHILEAARACPSVQSIVVVTTDKCYQNNEWAWGYREIDALGGKDPYSSSKACAELVVSAYQESLLPLADHSIKLACARGGNVVGGGDWAEDRLVPDIIHSLHEKKTIVLRNPTATRPWQHVLELVRGYLTLGLKLGTSEDNSFASAWNFGPNIGNEVTVEKLVTLFAQNWGDAETSIEVIPSNLKESHFLRLDASKARTLLDWHPALDIQQTIELTVDWYKAFMNNPKKAADLLDDQIINYAW